MKVGDTLKLGKREFVVTHYETSILVVLKRATRERWGSIKTLDKVNAIRQRMIDAEKALGIETLRLWTVEDVENAMRAIAGGVK